MNTIDVESIQANGRLFTWKKRIHTHLIYERLDRTIAIKDWSNIYPDTFESHGSFTCSDHCPIILSTVMQRDSRKVIPFCFQNYWCNYQQVDNLIKKSWGVSIKGTKMFQFFKKFKLIKYEVKDWSKK